MIYGQINHCINMQHFLIKICIFWTILAFSKGNFIDKCQQKDICNQKVTNFEIDCCESENFCMFCLILLGKGNFKFEKISVQARKNPQITLRYPYPIEIE